MSSLMQLKIKLKRKKPNFLRQDAHKLHLPKNWRRPRGMHNKMRLGKKGHRVRVDSGYRSPNDARYLHKSNLIPILANNMKDLEKLDNSIHAVIMSGKLGLKKKIQLIEKCNSLNIKILNLKDAAKFLEDVKKSRDSSKAEKKQVIEKRKKAREDLLKKTEEKESGEKTKTHEEKKEEEKQLEKKILEKETHAKPRHEMLHEKISDKSAKTDTVRTKIPTGGDRSV